MARTAGAGVREAVPDPITLRRAMGRFATGVAVVTTMVKGTPYGMTVNSLTSVSLDPPMLLVCLARGARTTQAVAAAGAFAINVLSGRQEKLAARFARRGEDHFTGLPITVGEAGMPVVPGALTHVACDVERTVRAGDHDVVLGAIRRVADREGEPLVFFSGRFGDFVDRGHEPLLWFC